MTFGEAIEALKANKFVEREDWNGKNMHLYLEKGHRDTIRAGVFKGSMREYAPHICIFTAQGIHQPGWLASQADMLATDWKIIKL